MMNRVKAARRGLEGRRGSVVIEAAFFFIVAAALLTGIIQFGSELNEYYQINALTDHIGQIIARSDTVSQSSVQTVLDDAASPSSTSLTGETLCVVVTWSSGATLSVPAACQCNPTQTTTLQASTTAPAIVTVNGCVANFTSKSIFVSNTVLGQ